MPTKAKSCRIIAILCFGFFVGCVLALDPTKELNQYVVEVKSSLHGLPQNSVLCVVQTSDGYLWMGTYDGLARYDGVNFTVFNKTTVPTMKHNAIHAMMRDSRDTLWIGTPKGLLRYAKGQFHLFALQDGLSGEYVFSLYEDHAGRVWVGTTHGLNCIVGDVIVRSYTMEQGLSHNYISSISEDLEGRLWIGTNGGGLNLLQNDRVTIYKTSSGLPSDTIWAVYRTRDGRMWIGTNNGLAVYENGKFQNYTTENGLPSKDIRTIYQDRDGMIWMGTFEGELIRMKDGKFTSSFLRGETVNRICSFCEDHEGSLWVGTYRKGVFQVKADKFILWNSSNGLPVDQVRSVFEDSEGSIWIGTVGGGLVRFQNGKFQVYGKKEGLANDRVWSITQSPDGAIWFGTYGGGLHRLKDGKVTVYSTKNGLSNDVIRSVLVDRRGNIWVGTDGGGVNVLSGDRIIHYTTKNGLSDDFIYGISEDKDGAIWIGTLNGELNRIKDGQLTRFGEIQVLEKTSMWTILPVSNGSLWIGTSEGGLTLYQNGKFSNFTVHDGLYSDVAFAVVDDLQGHLWMNCNQGIYRVQKSDLMDFARKKISRIPCFAFSKNEGLNIECSGPAQPAGCRSRDGKLWFCSIQGVIMIDPKNIRTNTIPPPVKIEKVLINGLSFSSDKKVIAKPGKGDLEIHYTGLSFFLPSKVLFKYRLEGYDTGWVSAEQRRSAYYTNLPPGEYTFRVKACNNDGVWNETGASFSFYLKPHFYQTIWFYSVCILAAILAGLSLYLIRVRQLKAHAKNLELIVEDRTRDLRERNEELETMNTIIQVINRELDLDKVLQDMIKEARVLFPHAEKAAFVIRDEATDLYRVAAVEGYDQEQLKSVAFTRQEAVDRYVTSGEKVDESVYIVRQFANAPGAGKIANLPMPKSMLTMLLRVDEQVEGFLILDNMSDPEAFDRSDVRKLFRFLQHALSAFNKAKTLEQLAREKKKSEKALEEIQVAHEALEKATRALEIAARVDPLTKLSNRRDILEKIEVERTRFDRYHKPFSLALGDIDDFKSVNDRYGHDCGDYVLVTIANLMRNVVRKLDSVGRWGGEEMILVYPDTDVEGGKIATEKVRNRIADYPFEFRGNHLSVTITFGLAEYGTPITIDELVKHADEALYVGKTAGKNRVVIAGNGHTLGESG